MSECEIFTNSHTSWVILWGFVRVINILFYVCFGFHVLSSFNWSRPPVVFRLLSWFSLTLSFQSVSCSRFLIYGYTLTFLKSFVLNVYWLFLYFSLCFFFVEWWYIYFIPISVCFHYFYQITSGFYISAYCFSNVYVLIQS